MMQTVLGLLGLLAPFWIAPVYAQQAGAPNSGGPSVQASNAFDAMQIASIGGLFSSCQGASIAGGLGAAAACVGSTSTDIKDGAKSLSCESFSVDGAFSLELADKRLKGFEQSAAGISCQKGKLDMARGQLQCLSNQATALAAQIGSLAGEYQRNLSRMQGEVAQLNSQIIDRKEQDKEVLMMINGDGESGREGLANVKQQIEAELAAMPASLAAVQKSNQDVANARSALNESVVSQTVVLANECFEKKSDASYLCQKNSAPVKLKDYVLCRYEQNQRKGVGDVIEGGKVNESMASAKRAALAQLLDELFQDVPKTRAGGAGLQSAELLKFEDLEQRFKSRLEAFNGKGLEISSFVISNAKSCFNRAEKAVDRERKMASSALGQQRAALIKLEKDSEAEVRKKFQEYNQSYVKAMKSLTGNNYPLVLTACERGTADVQERCFKQIEGELRGTLMGNTPQSTVAMSIKSTKPENAINFTCQGINGCLSGLQNISTKLKQEVIKAKAFKRDYVLKANQSIDMFTARMATTLGIQNEALDQQIRGLNSALAGLGVKGTIELNPIEAEEMERDGEIGEDSDNGMGGLYKMPKSLMKLVGGKMAPPLLNVTENSFKEALGGIAESLKGLDDKKDRIQESIDQIASLKSECLRKEEDAITKKLDEVLGKVGECSSTMKFCDSGGADTLAELRESVSRMGLVDGEPDISGTLSKGIDQCSRTQATLERAIGNGSAEERDQKRADKILGETSSIDCSAVVTSVKSRASELSSFRERKKDRASAQSAQ